MRIILSLITTFIVYVICKNLDCNLLLGCTLVCMTMGGFVMNELRIILKEIQSNK